MHLRLYWQNESNTCTLVEDNHLCTLSYTGKNEIMLITLQQYCSLDS